MYKKILVPLDGSSVAECVLPHVAAIARGCQTPGVILVQAVEPLSVPYGREISELKSIEQATAFEAHRRVDAEKYLSATAARLGKAGIKAKAEVIYGKAAEALSDFAAKNGVDLVVIATHGRSGVSRWVWGSVTDRVLRSAGVPILMVRAPGCIPGM